VVARALGGPGATLATPAGTSTGRSPAVSTTFPPQEPGRHGWTDLLRLIGDLRRLAFSNLDDADIARRIRDRFGEYDGRFHDDC
jgi:hypothetical protein